ncbi:MAG: hypothetical protein AAFO29_17945, partial [Actinomycetota bacterium]
GSEENPAWGLCWWNNDQAHYRLPGHESAPRTGPMTPAAPPDMISARGALENRLFIVPSRDLVVARTTRAVEQETGPVPFDRPFWELLADGDGQIDRRPT